MGVAMAYQRGADRFVVWAFYSRGRYNRQQARLARV